MNLQVEAVNEFIKGLYTEKGKVLGTFEMDVDGYFYFWRNENLKGYDSSDLLRKIADKLDEVNKEWDEHLKNNL
jgi:hypothetical protein